MWPFKKKPKKEFKPRMVIDTIEFVDKDGTRYKYQPTEDITVHEVALLWPLCYAQWVATDLFGYIREYNLLRHFKEITKE